MDGLAVDAGLPLDLVFDGEHDIFRIGRHQHLAAVGEAQMQTSLPSHERARGVGAEQACDLLANG